MFTVLEAFGIGLMLAVLLVLNGATVTVILSCTGQCMTNADQEWSSH